MKAPDCLHGSRKNHENQQAEADQLFKDKSDTEI